MSSEQPMKAVAEKLGKRKYKPKVTVGVDIRTDSDIGPDPSWRAEERKRCEAEIKAIQKELDNFDEKEAATKVRRGLEIRLKSKKIRLEELKLKMMPDYY